MATRMRLMARSVTCKPPTCEPGLGAAGNSALVSACAGAAKAPCAGFDSIVTMFDILAFSRFICFERARLQPRRPCGKGIFGFSPRGNVRSEERRVGKE